jgi:hypothetical protein
LPRLYSNASHKNCAPEQQGLNSGLRQDMMLVAEAGNEQASLSAECRQVQKNVSRELRE